MGRVKEATPRGFNPMLNTLDGVKLISFYGPDSSARNCKRCIHFKNGCTNIQAKKLFGYKPEEEMKPSVPPRDRAVHCKEYWIH